MQGEELKFANDARNAVENASVPGAWAMLFAIAALLCGAVWWASWASVEQTTNGQGRVIPSRQTQKVESLDSGIVTEILIKEGDRVEKGQNLIRVDDTGVSSRLGELQQRQFAFAAELHRLKIQASQSETFVFPENLEPSQVEFHEDQKAIFDTEKRRLKERVSILQSQLIQREQTLQEAIANSSKQENALKLAERELELTKNLFSKKAVPETGISQNSTTGWGVARRPGNYECFQNSYRCRD